MSTWGLRGTLAAVGISAVVAGIGGAAIYAATGNGPHMMGMTHGVGQPPSGLPGGLSPSPPAPFGDATLHGEFVVSGGSGRLTTMLVQTGRVTAISPTSVTARSDDGYSQTYAIAALGPAAMSSPHFVVNDEVTIRATRAGKTAEVTTIGYARVGGGPTAPPPPIAGHP